jgi:diguanylate cyclase (GGDEF)-like protein
MSNSDDTTYFMLLGEQPVAVESKSWTACLVVLQGTNPSDRILITGDEMTIGRAKNCDICLSQEVVSRVHATIQRLDEQKFLLIDNNSTNGTLINGKDIKKTQLKDQDHITIGNTVLKFVASNSPEQEFYDEIYRQTHLDKVLQIYNKQYFLTKLAEKINRCQRYDSELSLILFDVDHFKQFNDLHGHLAGDTALIHLSEVAKRHIGNQDVLCRYGGEEFAILMPHADAQQAYELAEKLRLQVANTPLHYADSSLNITISLGIASYLKGLTHEGSSLINEADSALYRAKHGGRNKTVAQFS